MVFTCDKCGKEFERKIAKSKHEAQCIISHDDIDQEIQVSTQEETNIPGLELMIHKLNKRIDLLDSKLETIISLLGQKKTSEYCVVKKGKLNLDDMVIKTFLNEKSIESDAEMLNLYYLKDKPSNKRPIRMLKKNGFQYYSKELDWVNDSGNNLREILADNIKKTYTKVLKFEKGDKERDAYMSGMNYINKLGTIEYQKNLLDVFKSRYLNS